jgi:hypothetical protein
MYNMPITIGFFSWERINRFPFISYGKNSFGICPVWYKSKDLERIKDVYRGTTVLYDWRFTTNQFVLATSSLRLTTSNFFYLNTWGCNPCVTSSLMIGWVCRLQLLMTIASAIILRSECLGTHDHILLSHIRDSPNLEGQVPVFISQRMRPAQFYPQTLGSLFVASYDSQGYGRGIRTRLQTGADQLPRGPRYIASGRTQEKTPPEQFFYCC